MRLGAVVVTLILAVGPAPYGAKQLAMKVVEAPTNIGVNNIYHQQRGPARSAGLRLSPANFTGPPHLKYLQGRCYGKTSGEYRYELCPFDNVTQEELALRWNTYHGVLGVWRDWSVDNDSFAAMNMEDGDSCGGAGRGLRSTKVILVCGNRTELESVAEPTTCRYELRLRTPLVCHPASMLVYPMLSARHQAVWDGIATDLSSGYVTRQGYDKRLRRLLITAGLVVEADAARAQQQQAARSSKLEQAQFDSLMDCQSEYRTLRSELAAVKAALAVLQADREQPAELSASELRISDGTDMADWVVEEEGY